MNTSLDWLRQACADFVQTLPPSSQHPTAAAADFHLAAISKDLVELREMRAKIQAAQQEMERLGTAAPCFVAEPQED